LWLYFHSKPPDDTPIVAIPLPTHDTAAKTDDTGDEHELNGTAEIRGCCRALLALFSPLKLGQMDGSKRRRRIREGPLIFSSTLGRLVRTNSSSITFLCSELDTAE
jgi:hypothetical protein